jgi:hypothetical protein
MADKRSVLKDSPHSGRPQNQFHHLSQQLVPRLIRSTCRLRQHARSAPTGCMPSTTPGLADLPSGAELRDRERRARQSGTALVASDLQGTWLLDQVWPKGSDRPASFNAALLRGLGARLEIRLEEGDLTLRNAVRLGALELSFRGPGQLMGSRPLLRFRFESLELSLAGHSLLRRALAVPAEQRMPFFALIARAPEGWLAARGRGGGLALWRLEPGSESPPPQP